MSDETRKTSRGPRHADPGATPADPGATPADPGHLAEDDLGNITWKWANDAVLQADDTMGAIQRLRALVDPSLGVIDDGTTRSSKLNPTGLKTGYDPYDSGMLVRGEPRKKKPNLRELSKWIAARRDPAEPDPDA